jgi:hypothetical protein
MPAAWPTTWRCGVDIEIPEVPVWMAAAADQRITEIQSAFSKLDVDKTGLITGKFFTSLSKEQRPEASTYRCDMCQKSGGEDMFYVTCINRNMTDAIMLGLFVFICIECGEDF